MAQTIGGNVLGQQGEEPRVRLEANYPPGFPHLVRRQQGEVSPVGADIHKAHSGPESRLDQRRLLRLVAAGEADFARDRIAQITAERPTAQLLWRSHPA